MKEISALDYNFGVPSEFSKIDVNFFKWKYLFFIVVSYFMSENWTILHYIIFY